MLSACQRHKHKSNGVGIHLLPPPSGGGQEEGGKSRARQRSFKKARELEIQVLHRQRIGLNEFAPRLHDIAHQLGEDVISLGHILNAYL